MLHWPDPSLEEGLWGEAGPDQDIFRKNMLLFGPQGQDQSSLGVLALPPSIHSPTYMTIHINFPTLAELLGCPLHLLADSGAATILWEPHYLLCK